ncbi:hypothetical protein MNBD_GAMMA25-118 [hydrothermal vent metagenome]|uniref:Uncharacterized protein n=1 Tax=hydrothermal vent metagenome TaxID=652676 RepID=A0A3B1BAP5_9ZZZZ
MRYLAAVSGEVSLWVHLSRTKIKPLILLQLFSSGGAVFSYIVFVPVRSINFRTEDRDIKY